MTKPKEKKGRRPADPSQVPVEESAPPPAVLESAAALEAEDRMIPYIGDVPVYCAHRAIVPIEKLVPNPKNPNKHPDHQIDLLAKIIKATGWRTAITVSNRSGFIVRGHGRYLAAIRAGQPAAPTDFQDYESEAAEWADMIADNRIAELAEMDTELLKEGLTSLDTGAFDMELTGFDSESLEDLLAGFPAQGGGSPTIPAPPTQQEPTLPSQHLVEIRCGTEALKAMRETLAEWGKIDGVQIAIS